MHLSLIKRFVIVILAYCLSIVESGHPKHIIYILTDDQGYADVNIGPEWDKENFATPNLRMLADNGILLNRFYVQPSCSPTRGSLLTGRYTNIIGFQDSAIIQGEKRGLPFKYKDGSNVILLPELLSQKKFKSVGIGKWHLGSHKQSYLPLNRGFDHFYGPLLGGSDYFTSNIGMECGTENPTALFSKKPAMPATAGYNCFAINGYSLLDDNGIAMDQLQDIRKDKNMHGILGKEGKGPYLTERLGDRALQRINEHDPQQPLFLYFAATAPHAPLQVPASYDHENCTKAVTHNVSEIKGGRKIICNMMYALDLQVGRIVDALRAKGMYDESIIFYSSDNGGMPYLGNSNGNFRSQKGSFLEGGVRVPAFVSGGALARGDMRETSALIHITDIFATIIHLAGMLMACTLVIYANMLILCYWLDVRRMGHALGLENVQSDGTPFLNVDGTWRPDFHRPYILHGLRGVLYGGNSSSVIFYAPSVPADDSEHATAEDHLWKLTYYPSTQAFLLGQPELCMEACHRTAPTFRDEFMYLYDLTADPYEMHNRYKELIHHEVVRRGKELTDMMKPTSENNMMESILDQTYQVLDDKPTPKGCWFPCEGNSTCLNIDCMTKVHNIFVEQLPTLTGRISRARALKWLHRPA